MPTSSPLCSRAARLLAVPALLGLIVTLPALSGADVPHAVPAPDRRPLPLVSPVQDKNFFLLSLLERNASVRKALAGSAALQRLANAKRAALPTVFEQTKGGVAASITELRFNEDEIAEAGKALEALYRENAEVRRLTDGPLRSSGVSLKYGAEPGGPLLAKAWRDCALGINNAIDVYGLGKGGRSSAIDSMSYDAKSFLYGALLHNIVGVIQEDAGASELWFQPGLALAMALLDANRRDEAGRFEPMERGENRPAYRRAATIAWNRYPYSVIVVPGEGPEETGVRLDPIGKLRLTIAVRRFREGKAPFLLVSGGFVHPKQTPFSEAMEMKRSLIADFGIPESAIIVDPHARHTTTNLRNAARLIYRYGIPFDMPALISTDTFQSDYIESAGFQERCRGIFGYLPHTSLKRLSPFDLEFRPTLDSLNADPMDPLDP